MRGCSPLFVGYARPDLVPPAYAGMFPSVVRPLLFPWCSPRVCGDVPEDCVRDTSERVPPAYAGMFPGHTVGLHGEEI
jgi:hypothetical protein